MKNIRQIVLTFVLLVSVFLLSGRLAQADDTTTANADQNSTALFSYTLSDTVTLTTISETINYTDNPSGGTASSDFTKLLSTANQTVTQYVTFAVVKNSDGDIVNTYAIGQNIYSADTANISGAQNSYTDTNVVANDDGTLNDKSGRTWTSGTTTNFPAVANPVVDGYVVSTAGSSSGVTSSNVPEVSVTQSSSNLTATVVYKVYIAPLFGLPFTGGSGTRNIVFWSGILGATAIVLITIGHHKRKEKTHQA